MFAIVARSSTDSESSPWPKYSTNLPTTPFLRSICVTVSTRSVAVTPSRRAPEKRNPITSGMSIEIGWTSAAGPPARDCEAIDHGGVAIGTNERVREGLRDAGLFPGPYGLRQIFEVDLMADAGSRGYDAEICKRAAPPAQELVALLIALIFEIDVDLEGARIAKAVDHHGMVDHEIDGDERINLCGIAMKGIHRIAHCGKVDHRGHAGEVLHQYARGPKR